MVPVRLSAGGHGLGESQKGSKLRLTVKVLVTDECPCHPAEVIHLRLVLARGLDAVDRSPKVLVGGQEEGAAGEEEIDIFVIPEDLLGRLHSHLPLLHNTRASHLSHSPDQEAHGEL